MDTTNAALRARPLTSTEVLRRSHGEVTDAAALQSEAIFGPDEGFACACGAVAHAREADGACGRCGGAVGARDPRVARFGHIALAAPVVHPWYLAARPSPLALLCGLRHRDLERVVAGAAYAVIDPGPLALARGAVLSPVRCHRLRAAHPELRAETGAEALQALWAAVDPAERVAPARTRGQRKRAVRRAQWLRRARELPASVLLEALPVAPPGLRRAGQDARYARVLAANGRVRADATMAARCELQRAVCALFGGRAARALEVPRERRVDFSAVAPVAPGPALAAETCALPVALAVELFGPLLHARLVARGAAMDPADARDVVACEPALVHDALEELCDTHPVLLAREALVSREDLAAFRAVLTDGAAVRVHPARFERFAGDRGTVRVFLAVSHEARGEALQTMALTSGADAGERLASALRPGREALLGLYLATREEHPEGEPVRAFASLDAVEAAYEHGAVGLRAKVRVRVGAARVETTVGRALVGRLLPATVPFARVNCEFRERRVQELIESAARRLAPPELRGLLERLWAFGLACAERHGLSLALHDMASPATKQAVLAEAYARVAKIADEYLACLSTDGERYNKTVDALAEVADLVSKDALQAIRGGFHPLFVLADSGAGVRAQQIRRLVAMRGLMARADGQIHEVPVARSLAEGLTAHEFALGSIGPRREVLEDAAREATAASLSERVARVVRPLRVTEDDCGAPVGRTFEWVDPREFSRRLVGQFALGDVRHPASGVVLVRDGEAIDADALRAIEAAGLTRVTVRWPAGCRARGGVCRRCYGAPSALGDAVGLKAALALREQLPQLVRRVFHIC